MSKVRRLGRALILAGAVIALTAGCGPAVGGAAAPAVSLTPVASASVSIPPVTSSPSATPVASPTAASTAASTTTSPIPVSSGPSSPLTIAPVSTLPSTNFRPPTSAPSTPVTTTSRSTPATTHATTARPPTTPTAAASKLCPQGSATSPAPIVSCLSSSVGEFWSATLNQAVSQKVVANPAVSAVPADCRPGLSTEPAFTCLIDNTLYITPMFTQQIKDTFTGRDVVYAYGSVLSHEIGHVVQGEVHQPGYGVANGSNAAQQKIEQQADCLSGVWAASRVATGQLDAARFLDVSEQLIALNSNNPEIATHGTPPVRRAAIQRGLTGGRPQACSLATFS